MKEPSTRTIPPISWGGGGDGSGKEIPHLVIAWSHDEWDRVGEAAPIEGPSVLGRDSAASEDDLPLIGFAPHRLDTLASPAVPLRSALVSRRHLRLTPLEDGSVDVRCDGRCPLVVGGRRVDRAIVRPGDTLLLPDVMLLLVVSRQPGWWKRTSEELNRLKLPEFLYGAADRHGIVGESPAAWALREALAFAGRLGNHVLVHGESGAGKELAARALHALSSQREGPFVARNAATLPEGLVDAELFGNAARYPHPDSRERAGLIGEADGGTLFLDEIGEMRHDVQAHLLRVLDQGGEYRRLGEDRARRSRFRLVAATNRAVAALKHDFAARLNLRVPVPGLDQRREDIPLLIRHVLRAAMRDHPDLSRRFLDHPGRRLDHASVDPQLVEALIHHEYTLHTRELSSMLLVALKTSRGRHVALTKEVRDELGRAVATARARKQSNGRGEEGVAISKISKDPKKGKKKGRYATIGRGKIEAALRSSGGKVAPAARALGLKNRHVLIRLMIRHGLRGSDDGGEEGE